MKVAILAGGVGGAKLVHGLSLVLPPRDLTAIVNTGDDFRHFGLHISPDLDTVMYTLAGLANPQTGWGIAGDTFACLAAVERLGGDAWFQVGDRNLATHLRRTNLLAGGKRLTEATLEICRALGTEVPVLPMSDSAVRTMVSSDEGDLEFQDYFVRRACQPRVNGFHFAGIETARPSPEVVAAIEEADAIVIGPSNPFVSIDPILSLPGVREGVRHKPSVAVTPIVGGEAIKGPAAKMLSELGFEVSARTVAARYSDCISGFIVDQVDASIATGIEDLGMACRVAQTVMLSDTDRRDLAREVIAFVAELEPRR